MTHTETDSGVQQVIKKMSFNLCDDQGFDTLLEKSVFYEVFNGFRVEGIGKLCPIMVRRIYTFFKFQLNLLF